jgi:hypothetical protein
LAFSSRSRTSGERIQERARSEFSQCKAYPVVQSQHASACPCPTYHRATRSTAGSSFVTTRPSPSPVMK